MTLYDEIIDEAEEIASSRVLGRHATREEITVAVRTNIGKWFSPNSPFGFLAEASYNRYSNAMSAIQEASAA
jgi:hypothetical protein